MIDLPRDSQRVLVVDDDERIRQMVSRYLEEAGYQVSVAPDGEGLREELRLRPVDLILLDLVLPGDDDGLTLAREIRRTSDVPIIMLSGRDEVVDRVVGLEVGADDYISKPFHLREVLARVRTVLRRHHHSGSQAREENDRTIRFSGWLLDPQRRLLSSPRGEEVDLTTGEFELLLALARHPGRVFSRDALMTATRGRHHEAFDRSIDTQIARLRKKLDFEAADAHALIKSVRGIGYVFTGHVAAAR
ncbi:response regulator transcription factor [Bosea sp. TND4EK4]|uniref:response regulator n=1 Tax=Bosea sp. TND4EK4 TaxID=1907408 RepID=UPI00097025FC|nr:response regulator transcription factor [Bosea sp. TND4EK4]